MVKIGYIDNKEKEIRKFIRKSKMFNFENPERNLELIEIQLKEELKQTIVDIILSDKIEGLIIDYYLTEFNQVSFEGSDLMDIILDKIPNYPVIILTNNLNDAENNTKYIHKIYSKKENDENTENNHFIFSVFNRVLIDVKNFKKNILEYEERVEELTKKAQEKKLSAIEESELLLKDRFLENLISKKEVPIQFKNSTSEEKLDKIIKNTEKLIEKLKKNEK